MRSIYTLKSIKSRCFYKIVGLSLFLIKNSKIKEIKSIEFDHKDVIRHPLVSKIIQAYNKKESDD